MESIDLTYKLVDLKITKHQFIASCKSYFMAEALNRVKV